MGGERPSQSYLLGPATLTADAFHVALTQRAVQYGRGDDGVVQELAPLAENLGGSEGDAAPFIAGRDSG